MAGSEVVLGLYDRATLHRPAAGSINLIRLRPGIAAGGAVQNVKKDEMMSVELIQNKYNANRDMIPGGPDVNWVDMELLSLIEGLQKRVEVLERTANEASDNEPDSLPWLNRVQKVSRLVVILNNAIPINEDKLVILEALNKLQSRIIETMRGEIPTLEETMTQCPNCGDKLNNDLCPHCG